MLKEFKEFATKGNIFDMAIGVIIGGAFQKIVTSLVNDIIMPIIAIFTGKVNFNDLSITVGNSSVKYGSFITTIVDFLIIAFSIFIAIRTFNKLNDKGINVTSVNILDLSFSAEFDAAIEKKQIVEQQTQQAKYELEKAKVENEKKIENAKAEAEVMKQQNAEITDKTLELKRLEVQQTLINKWNRTTSYYNLIK